MGHRPKCKLQAIKLLNDNMQKNPDDIGDGDDFLDQYQKHDL